MKQVNETLTKSQIANRQLSQRHIDQDHTLKQKEEALSETKTKLQEVNEALAKTKSKLEEMKQYQNDLQHEVQHLKKTGDQGRKIRDRMVNAIWKL